MTEPPTGPDGDTPTEDPAPSYPNGRAAPGGGGTAGPSEQSGRPPGASVFSLDRPASGLYLVAWLLTGLGLATVFVGLIATSAGKQLAFAGFLTATLGLMAACAYQVVARRATRAASAYRGPSPLLGLATAVMLGNGLALALGLVDPRTDPTGRAFALAVLIPAIGYLVVVVLLVVRTGALSWAQMGWPVGPGRVGRFVGDAAFGLIVTVPVVVPVLIGAGILASILHVQPTARIPTVEGAVATAFVFLGAAVVAPIAEEIFFRGYALSAWQRDLGPRPALVRSALFFALVHIANVSGATFGDAAGEAVLQVAVIVPLGFVLGWVYQRRSIGASIAGHIGYNGTLLVLAAAAGQLGGGLG